MLTEKNNPHVKSKTVLDLSQNGCVKFENMFDIELMNQIRGQFELLIKDKENISTPQNVSKAIQNNTKWQDVERLDLGKIEVEDVRKYTNLITLKDPLIKIPKLLDIGLNERIISEVTKSLGIRPYLSFIKIRKSVVNELPRYDSQEWHIDGNGKSIIKVFLLISDVDHYSGPTEYLVNSHLNGLNTDTEKRWTSQELNELFPNFNILKLDGKPGTVYIADTLGFHRAGVPEKKDRVIAIFNYVTEEEYKGLYEQSNVSKIRITKNDYEVLSPDSKKICSLMEVV